MGTHFQYLYIVRYFLSIQTHTRNHTYTCVSVYTYFSGFVRAFCLLTYFITTMTHTAHTHTHVLHMYVFIAGGKGNKMKTRDKICAAIHNLVCGDVFSAAFFCVCGLNFLVCDLYPHFIPPFACCWYITYMSLHFIVHLPLIDIPCTQTLTQQYTWCAFIQIWSCRLYVFTKCY